MTRVATQELEEEQGLLREALNSLYSLFAITRELLKDSRPSIPAPGGQAVEHMAITMLNWELRPMLSTWHPRLLRYEEKNPGKPESSWEDAQACRAELRTTQDHLREYCPGFARLAGVRKAKEMMTPVGPAARDRQP